MKYSFINTVNESYAIELQYKYGRLKSVNLNFPGALPITKMQKLFSCLAIEQIKEVQEGLAELNFRKVNRIGTNREVPKQNKNPNDHLRTKIKLWYSFWKKVTGLPYNFSTTDVAKLKKLQTSVEHMQQLLDIYAKADKWYSKDPTLGGFIANQNSLLADLLQEHNNPYGFATVPCKTDEAKIKDPKKLMAYWHYYRKLGWKKNKRTNEWYKD